MEARTSRSATTPRRNPNDGRVVGRRAVAILRALPDAVLLFNSNGIVVDANPAAESMFGRSMSPRSSDPIFGDLVVLSDSYNCGTDGPERSVAVLLSGDTDKAEGRAIHADETACPIEISLRTISVQGRQYGAAICRDIAERRRLEYEVLHVSDEERTRISHDLHDGLGSLLTGASFALHAVAGSIRKGNVPDVTRIAKIAELVDEGATAARDIARGLSPLDGSATLEEGISRVVGHTLALSGMHIEADVGPVQRQPAPRVATQLYRIAQEALQNAVKHADASVIRVVLRGTDEQVALEVVDDGIGPPRERDPEVGSGIGIRLMRYRAHLIGASLSIKAGVSGGTRVGCVYPFSRDTANQAGVGSNET